MTQQPDFSDHELRDALRNTADPVDPSPSESHFNLVRGKLRAWTAPSVPGTLARRHPTPESRLRLRSVRILLRLATLAACVLIAFVAARSLVGTAAAGLRSVLDVTRRNTWIHSSTTVTHAGETIQLESWCAPAQRITASRSPQMLHFVDFAEGIQTSYSAKTDTVFRWRADMGSEGINRSFVNALLSDGDLTSSFPWHKVSEVKVSNVVKDGAARRRYSFQLELKTMPKVQWETAVFADPATGLIDTWEEVHADGTLVVTHFDYPTSGPSDIFQLGASPAAKRVDRVASADIVTLAKQFQEQICQFNDYEALVVDQPMDSDGAPKEKPLLRCIRRRGNSFSVELLQPRTNLPTLPMKLDLAWWKSHRNEFQTIPLAICNGETCRIYPCDQLPPYVASETPFGHKLATIPVGSIRNSNGAKTIPLWPSLWPEYACRPLLNTADPTIGFDMDPAGTDGPPNTLRIRVVEPDSPFSKERANYWLALDHSHCLAKSIVAHPALTVSQKDLLRKPSSATFPIFAFHPLELSTPHNESLRI